MTGMYNTVLVLLSLAVAVVASFTALSLAGRIRGNRGWHGGFWVGSSAVALGAGIWSMHFIAMLAYSMPGMAMAYDPLRTLLSLALALIFTAAGFSIQRWHAPSLVRTGLAGLLMGSGILAMHYVGMAAMRMAGHIVYDPAWVAVSAVIAILAATTAIGLAGREQGVVVRFLAATAMGGAIAGMHFAGMRAATFVHHGNEAAMQDAARLDSGFLALGIAGLTLVILLMALGAARVDRLFLGAARREARIALRLEIADVLRDSGSVDALPLVAALMGRHFGVGRAGYGQLDLVSETFDFDVCWTEPGVAELLGNFPAAAFGRKVVQRLCDGRTVAMPDLLRATPDEAPRASFEMSEQAMRALLVVPFAREANSCKVVYLNDSKPRPWHPDEIAFVEELAERTRLVVERDRAVQELRDLNATLEARVEARTADLHTAQKSLIQHQKMEAVGQLASGIAHDFNNLLGALVGALEIIRRKAEDPAKVRHFADMGLLAAEKGTRLTGQLLSFSRARAVEYQAVDLRETLEQLGELLRRTLGPTILLEQDFGPDRLTILGDPTQIEMMVLNLAINARDAMPGGGTLAIRTRAVTLPGGQDLKAGSYAEITVADSGVGMDEATLHRAMDPFFTTKDPGKGTGLGLSQIYGSVRQAGGSVRIESAPARGTVVTVLLPLTADSAAGTAEIIASRNQARQALRILLVDDDVLHRGILASALGDFGHVTVEAGDGEEALAAFMPGAFDLVLLDFAMPGLNGAQVAAQIQARSPDQAIVFQSGFADTDVIRGTAGAEAIIVRKPFRQEDLLIAIETAAPRNR